MIEQIPDRLERTLRQTLMPNERVLVKLKGAFKEALVCTDTRVLIMKGGWMTGQILGTDTFQCPYSMVAGAEVRFHLLTGYFELSTGGMQNSPKSFWQGGSEAHRRQSTELRVDQRAGDGAEISAGKRLHHADGCATVCGSLNERDRQRANRSGDRRCLSGALFFRAGNQIPL